MCWSHIALRLPVERWWSCTSPGSGKSGPIVEGWWSCASPGSGKSGSFFCFLWCAFAYSFVYDFAGSRSCTSSRWGMTSSTRKSAFSFLHRRPGRGLSIVHHWLRKKYVKGLQGSRPIPRIDECSEATAARWIAEAGVPALYATSAYFSIKTRQVQKGSGYSVSWCSNFMKALMNHLSQKECLMKWNDFCGKGRRSVDADARRCGLDEGEGRTHPQALHRPQDREGHYQHLGVDDGAHERYWWAAWHQCGQNGPNRWRRLSILPRTPWTSTNACGEHVIDALVGEE